MAFERIEGWEGRFNALINRYAQTPFEWGHTDCFFFVADTIESICGINPMQQFRGAYTDEKTAFDMLRLQTGGVSFEPLFDGLKRYENPLQAPRASVGILTIDGVQFCGVVSPSGRHFYRRTNGTTSNLIADKMSDVIQSLQLWGIE